MKMISGLTDKAPMEMETNEVWEIVGGSRYRAVAAREMEACIALHKKDGTEKRVEMKKHIVLY